MRNVGSLGQLGTIFGEHSAFVSASTLGIPDWPCH